MSNGVSDEQKALVSYQTRLQVFLYVLIRDHVTFGTLELIMRDQVDKVVGVADFSEPSAAEYCLFLADRILRGETLVPARPVATDGANPNTGIRT